MVYTYFSVIMAVALFVGMLLLFEVGRRAGIRQKGQEAASARTGLGAIDAAIFSLLGLLVAFTFSGAAMRFDARRQLAIQETNSISTAWLRIDLLPIETQAELRELFRQYLDARLRVVSKLPDVDAVKDELRRCNQLQIDIWARSRSSATEAGTPLGLMLFLPALNQMFDIASTRTATAQIHPPLIIFIMLLALSLATALFAGHGTADARKRSWIHSVGLAAAIAAAIWIIVDLEYPRIGLIRMDASDQLMVDSRQAMDTPH